MPITHTSRTGKTYYLHTGPLAERVPEGFEIRETVNGQVYLRRQQPKLIRDDELDCIRVPLARPRAGHRYQVEAEGKVITVHESCNDFGFMRSWATHLSVAEHESIETRFAHYQPVLRFTLVDQDGGAPQPISPPCFRMRS